MLSMLLYASSCNMYQKRKCEIVAAMGPCTECLHSCNLNFMLKHVLRLKPIPSTVPHLQPSTRSHLPSGSRRYQAMLEWNDGMWELRIVAANLIMDRITISQCFFFSTLTFNDRGAGYGWFKIEKHDSKLLHGLPSNQVSSLRIKEWGGGRGLNCA